LEFELTEEELSKLIKTLAY